jgi:hypothetical protein
VKYNKNGDNIMKEALLTVRPAARLLWLAAVIGQPKMQQLRRL